jgi:hypothetical protein
MNSEAPNRTRAKRSWSIHNLPRFVPLQRLSNHRERLSMPSHRPLAKFHLPPTRLRPRVFTTPRRLAPPVICQAYFIPVPLMGFPLRGFLPYVEPNALSSAATFLELCDLFRRNRRHPQRSVNQGSVRSNHPLFQGLAPQHKSLQSSGV